jgi:hypothetical protein
MLNDLQMYLNVHRFSLVLGCAIFNKRDTTREVSSSLWKETWFISSMEFLFILPLF